VYVFTRKSQIIAMPRGATVVDFAYAIHSNVGDRTVSARVNGEVPLRTEIKNGDVIEDHDPRTPDPIRFGWALCARAAHDRRYASTSKRWRKPSRKIWAKKC
jgi:guanosine-3',5'-bis(diphosphate) 3'-pyrophosphohydrolase